MRTRRLTGPALGILAAFALGVSGCGDDGTATSPGGNASAGTPTSAHSSSAADPAAASALANAAAALDDTSFKITLTSGPGVKMTGIMDAPNSRASATLKATGPNTEVTVLTRLDGQDLYVQVPGVTKPSTWTRVDVARLPEGANLGLRPDQIDPANTAQLLSSTTDVHQTGSGSYAGTLDLTKVAGVTGVDKVAVESYGAAAENVPFTAGLDPQGRLSALTIQLPPVNGQQSQPLEVLYTDYGIKVGDLRPDRASVVEAPADLYETLGSR